MNQALSPSLYATYQTLVMARRQKILTADEFRDAKARIMKKQEGLNKKAEKARTKREEARQRQEQAEAIRREQEARRVEEARKAKKRAAATLRRQKRKSARIVTSLASYEVLRADELNFATVTDVFDGFISKWIQNIPAKQFILRITSGYGSKEVIKRNNEKNLDWWLAGNAWNVMAESEYTIFNKSPSDRSEMSVAPLLNMESVKRSQRIREGELHCVFAPLHDLYESLLETNKSRQQISLLKNNVRRCDEYATQYDGGITMEELEERARDLKTTITIRRVDNRAKTILNPRGKYSMEFINTRWNHADVYIPDANAIQLDIRDMRNKLDDVKDECIWEGSTFSPKSILHKGKKYSLKMPYQDMFEAFNKQIGREWFQIDYIQEKELFEYIQSAYKHNTHMKFGDISYDAKEMDCKAGYTQFKKAPFYKGFLGCVWDKCGAVPLSHVVKHIGIYTVRILFASPLMSKIGFEVGKSYTLTSPMIEYLTAPNHKVYGTHLRVEVVGGYYGSQVDFEFPAEFLQKFSNKQGRILKAGESAMDAVPLYSIWTGMTAASSSHRVIRCQMNKFMAEQIQNEGETILWEHDECYYKLEKQDGKWIRTLRENIGENPMGYMAQFISKEYSPNCPQIYAFITDYMRMNMIAEMDTIDLEDLIAWKVDSLIFKGDYTLRPMFREKEIKYDFEMSSSIFKSTEVTFEPREIVDTNTFFAGAGGSGKSHYAASFRRMLYIAPMWSMNVDFKNKYTKSSITPHKLLGLEGSRAYFETTSWRPATIFGDEATMWNDEWVNAIRKQFPHARFILAGDYDDKGRPFQTTYSSNIVSLNGFKRRDFITDYRSTDAGFSEIKQKIREFMYANYGDSRKLLTYVKELMASRVFAPEKVTEEYSLEDWVVVGTNENVNEWTEILAETGEKYLVTDHSQQHVLQAFAGEDVALNGDVIFYDNGRCELRHAFTTHSVQGKTIDSKLFIDLRRMSFNYPLLYTAISRARKLEQIYLIDW